MHIFRKNFSTNSWKIPRKHRFQKHLPLTNKNNYFRNQKKSKKTRFFLPLMYIENFSPKFHENLILITKISVTLNEVNLLKTIF